MECPTKLKKPAMGKSACCPRTAAPFKSDDELLEAAIPMFESRQRHRTTVQEGDATEETVRALRKQAVAWTRSWHKSFQMTEDSVVICRRSRECHLNELDREVLTVLLLNCLGLLPERAISCGGLLNVLGLAASEKLKALRAISENGRLVRRGLLTYDDPEEELITRTPVVDSLFVETVLSGNPRASTGWKVKSEAALWASRISIPASYGKIRCHPGVQAGVRPRCPQVDSHGWSGTGLAGIHLPPASGLETDHVVPESKATPKDRAAGTVGQGTRAR